MKIKNNPTKSLRLLQRCASLLLAPLCLQAMNFNMAYVEVNSNALANVGCYLNSVTNQPFFGISAIFAGNINGTSPNAPEIFFNSNVQAILESSQISHLQQK